ncbi:MarR family winged helix-turn-helix transcriptional regulator [Thermogemmatispora onikobensis]|uniref:MarR family winged helix-turn-helix transcriptional regulator n=1 Tax=Thermogemmatispora onikobensis TaxID=732234 RepID=UPI000853DC43|nr:MarR family winged helix-turn-helix transcriptional regulator [Thermogemmatispora onikobensis]
MFGESEPSREQIGKALTSELRQFQGLSTTFLRVVAARLNLTIADLQVIVFLDSLGPLTAGQLANLTGLTTGAITGMLNRLEEAGFVRRERDPQDARRVIVRLDPSQEKRRELATFLAAFDQRWPALLGRADEERLAFLLNCLRRSNSLLRQELARLQRLQAIPDGEEAAQGLFTAPLGSLTRAHLVVSGPGRLSLHGEAGLRGLLYQARFEGAVPEIKVRGEVVVMRYARRPSLLDEQVREAELTLNAAIPWRIVVEGGVAQMEAHLRPLPLLGLHLKGVVGNMHLELPSPTGNVPISIAGNASQLSIERPAGVPVRVHFKGWAVQLQLDQQTFNQAGGIIRLRSAEVDDSLAAIYDLNLVGSFSSVTITSRSL